MELLQKISRTLFGKIWYPTRQGVAVDRHPRSCLSASPLFGNLAIPLFLDKVNAGSPATKVNLLLSGFDALLTDKQSAIPFKLSPYVFLCMGRVSPRIQRGSFGAP